MISKKIILMFIIFIILISGCRLNNNNSITSDIDKIHEGKDGLVIKFIDNAPPKQVYEKDSFPIGIGLENKGAFDIKNSYVLLNIEEDNLELIRVGNREDLEIGGKSLGNPEGSFDVINFVVQAKELGSETETITSNIIVTACYKYQTFFSENVCIDTDFYNIKNKEKSCSSKENSFSSGQGAPISVTKIESKMLEEDNRIKPTFVLYLQNNGQGEVINSRKVRDMCSSTTISRDDINLLNIEADLYGELLSCKPEILKLRDQDNTVRCTLEKGVSKDVEPYTSILSVVLDYGYTETISQNVEIRKEI